MSLYNCYDALWRLKKLTKFQSTISQATTIIYYTKYVQLADCRGALVDVKRRKSLISMWECNFRGASIRNSWFRGRTLECETCPFTRLLIGTIISEGFFFSEHLHLCNEVCTFSSEAFFFFVYLFFTFDCFKNLITTTLHFSLVWHTAGRKDVNKHSLHIAGDLHTWWHACVQKPVVQSTPVSPASPPIRESLQL